MGFKLVSISVRVESGRVLITSRVTCKVTGGRGVCTPKVPNSVRLRCTVLYTCTQLQLPKCLLSITQNECCHCSSNLLGCIPITLTAPGHWAVQLDLFSNYVSHLSPSIVSSMEVHFDSSSSN